MFNKGKWISLVAVAVTSFVFSSTAVSAEEPGARYKKENVKGTCYFAARDCSGYSRAHIKEKSCYIDKGGLSWQPPKSNFCKAIR
ncbi:hypothetical protein IOQ59_11560 [Pontibacterium sp. N1Y112]|uniref:Uncharacterized protein n=1 Tax=Pontibacterium sinense TaxID=2781979 RepID=A0A8J7K642_9GAMM|nr:hypothetical protein [Pontibacterium sinense]MBE9397895.1 hypothetical protein [Pontibacterium sinense]